MVRVEYYRSNGVRDIPNYMDLSNICVIDRVYKEDRFLPHKTNANDVWFSDIRTKNLR